MIKPIQLQQLLNEHLTKSKPVISSLFVSTSEGSCIASAPNLQIKEQALQANLSMLFDDCQQIGRIKLGKKDEDEQQGTLSYAFVEHDTGIAIIAKIKNQLLLTVSCTKDQNIGILTKYVEKIKKAIEKQFVGVEEES